MTDRITQAQLDFAIERLVNESGVDIQSNDCYGYYQLMTNDGHALEATYGDSKKDLYYQIQFYLQMEEAKRRLKQKPSEVEK